MSQPDLQQLRNTMVEDQLNARGIKDFSVLEAMRRVARHEFVPHSVVEKAYNDCPLPIGEGQTVSQPYMVALMTQCLELNRDKRVFEIGTGSGYQTAVLAELCNEVYTIERIKELFERSKKNFQKFEYNNIKSFLGDGTQELLGDSRLFDAIIITAAASSRPENLFSLLSEQGRLVVPIGDKFNQMLTLYTKRDGQIVEEHICGCTFVPLIGRYGWPLH